MDAYSEWMEKEEKKNEVSEKDIKALDLVEDERGAVTQEQLILLKVRINEALGQLIQMFISLEDALDALNARIDVFNTKSSHKI